MLQTQIVFAQMCLTCGLKLTGGGGTRDGVVRCGVPCGWVARGGRLRWGVVVLTVVLQLVGVAVVLGHRGVGVGRGGGVVVALGRVLLECIEGVGVFSCEETNLLSIPKAGPRRRTPLLQTSVRNAPTLHERGVRNLLTNLGNTALDSDSKCLLPEPRGEKCEGLGSTHLR